MTPHFLARSGLPVIRPVQFTGEKPTFDEQSASMSALAITRSLRIQGQSTVPDHPGVLDLATLRVRTFKEQIGGADEAAKPLLDVQELLQAIGRTCDRSVPG
jgi:hypothetical protein